MTTKETILKQLREVSQQISLKYDNTYTKEIDNIAEELAISYTILFDIINNKQELLADNKFYAGTLLWTASNMTLAALALFRQGYSKEHLMLLRNSLETIAAAYVISRDEQKFKSFQINPDKFKSTECISIAKTVVPLLGKMYGLLSNSYTHVSYPHILPHKSKTPLCIGGLFDPAEQKYSPLILSMLLTGTEILNAFIERVYVTLRKDLRFWKIEGEFIHYQPIESIKIRQYNAINKIKASLNETKPK